MTGSKIIASITAGAALVVAGALGLGLEPAKAYEASYSFQVAQDIPGDKSPIAGQSDNEPADAGGTEDHAPKSPIRVKTIDYEDAAGTLKLAGTAATGTPLYLYFDNEPLAKVDADDQGNWSLERKMDLGTGQHILRAEQYDPTTRMLSGRAMITIGRAPSAPDNAGEAPEGTTP
jgi:hypothetical protein